MDIWIASVFWLWYSHKYNSSCRHSCLDACFYPLGCADTLEGNCWAMLNCKSSSCIWGQVPSQKYTLQMFSVIVLGFFHYCQHLLKLRKISFWWNSVDLVFFLILVLLVPHLRILCHIQLHEDLFLPCSEILLFGCCCHAWVMTHFELSCRCRVMQGPTSLSSAWQSVFQLPLVEKTFLFSIGWSWEPCQKSIG